MRAIVYTAAGDTGVIQLRDVSAPVAGPGEIRVRVHAAGLNRADILQRQGRYPAPAGWPADIPGLEYAGEVESLGPGATRWKTGDRVMGLVGGGAHAEFVVVHEDEAIAIPDHLSLTDAAAIPEAFLTAWDALVTRGRLQAGERVLIHAVGSGVGTAAVQLVRQLGATSAGTSRSPAKLARAAELGLDEGIDSSRGAGALASPSAGALASRGAGALASPGAGALASPGAGALASRGAGALASRGAGALASPGAGDHKGRPYDLILDVLGGPAFAANLEALAPRGRLVLLGFLQGARADVSLEPILRKRLEVIGSVMRSRALEERIPLVREFAERVMPMFEPPRSGRAPGEPPRDGRPQGSPLLDRGDVPAVRPIVGAIFPMPEIAAAHAAMERDENFGKIVLVWQAQ